VPVNEIRRQLNSESIARTCEAIDRVRLSRAATRHAIERSRKSLHETQALLVALRHIYLTSREVAADAVKPAKEQLTRSMDKLRKAGWDGRLGG
jgi:hypothetical protein